MIDSTLPIKRNLMHRYSYKPALTGQLLKEALDSTPEQRPAIIEGLLYENSILLVSSDPGIGKSTITANLIAQLSCGLPAFGQLFVPKPVVCYYIPFERGSQEIKERLKHIRTSIPFDESKIFIFENDEIVAPNLYDPNDQEFLLESISKDCVRPDIVIYDPIYASVQGGLSDETKVSVFTRFNTRLMARFKCSTLLNHHTGRKSYASDGSPIEKEDPYYGSIFLKAHCTASYYLKENVETQGTVFINKKDSHGNLLKRIPLQYEPETYTSFIPGQNSGLIVKDRLLMVVRQFKKDNKRFTFRQLMGCMVGVSDSHLREVLRTPPFNTILKKCKSNGEATLYEIDESI